ncbi:hypothetical protein BXZ70DRAFT_935130 [Cristinia sonorae]|uniref:Uncharacterized protein n=1 Tax=Cristinia sonorae TaxID=1940300 RepID=A0A8K0UP18_9AGAR|nr:hypothetical protein BXZ70DRAFT_935130 [Cristinia sonorae]
MSFMHHSSSSSSMTVVPGPSGSYIVETPSRDDSLPSDDSHRASMTVHNLPPDSPSFGALSDPLVNSRDSLRTDEPSPKQPTPRGPKGPRTSVNGSIHSLMRNNPSPLPQSSIGFLEEGDVERRPDSRTSFSTTSAYRPDSFSGSTLGIQISTSDGRARSHSSERPLPRVPQQTLVAEVTLRLPSNHGVPENSASSRRQSVTSTTTGRLSLNSGTSLSYQSELSHGPPPNWNHSNPPPFPVVPTEGFHPHIPSQRPPYRFNDSADTIKLASSVQASNGTAVSPRMSPRSLVSSSDTIRSHPRMTDSTYSANKLPSAPTYTSAQVQSRLRSSPSPTDLASVASVRTTARMADSDYGQSSQMASPMNSYIPSPTPTIKPIPSQSIVGVTPRPTPTVTVRPIPRHGSMDVTPRSSVPAPTSSSATLQGSGLSPDLPAKTLQGIAVDVPSNGIQRSRSQSHTRGLPDVPVPGPARRWSLAARNNLTPRATINLPSVSPVPESEYPGSIASSNSRIQVGDPAGQAAPSQLQPLRLHDTSADFPVNGVWGRFTHGRSRSETPFTEKESKKRRSKWTKADIQMLMDACDKHGVGNWDAMIRDQRYDFGGKTSTDLENRFRDHRYHGKTSILTRVKSVIPSFKKLRKRSLPPEEYPDGHEFNEKIGTEGRILNITSKALESEEYSGLLNLPSSDALVALNLVQGMLESRSSDSLTNADTEVSVRFPRSQLRRLVLDLSVRCQQVPSALFLQGVQRTDTESYAVGGFADIYRGTWHDQPIAIKCLRIFVLSPESQKTRLRQAFYRESLLWHNLQHKHVLPFYGVTADVFPHTLCMVLPWMNNGNIRQHMDRLRRSGELVNQTFVDQVNKWVSSAEYTPRPSNDKNHVAL